MSGARRTKPPRGAGERTTNVAGVTPAMLRDVRRFSLRLGARAAVNDDASPRDEARGQTSEDVGGAAGSAAAAGTRATNKTTARARAGRGSGGGAGGGVRRP